MSKREKMARRNGTQRIAARSLEQAGGTLAKANETWLENQAALFEHFDEMARRWLERRREALDATRQSLEELRSAGDGGEILRIQQEWLLGSMRRLSADLGELCHVAFTLSHRTVDQIGGAAERGIQHAERSRDEMLSVAGAKPRRP